MQASLWFDGADMRVKLAGVISSTVADSTGGSTASGSTWFVNSSTGVTLTGVWSTTSTGSTGNRVVTNQNMPYISGSDGEYAATVQSSAHSMAVGSNGFAEITVDHSGLDDYRRVAFRVEYRGTT